MAWDRKHMAGEERPREGPYIVECPHCGSPPGFTCRKPSSQTSTDHEARRIKAKAHRERERRAERV